MPQYKAPLRDIQFVMNEFLDAETHYQQIPGGEEATPDMVDAIIQEGAKFCEQVLSPLNQTGDQEGCRLENGEVKTPTGFKEAYKQYIEGGWPSMTSDVELGGQGLPNSLSMVMSEMVGTANWSFGMYPGLSHGCISTLEAHGSDEQKQTFLPKMISGEWTGTMCLTESHCGSDLGIIRSKATPNSDGSYAITGEKIFISAGDHDMAENIIHLVLAKLPDAPKGTKGISVFVVPKFIPDANGNPGERNNVSVGSIEEKMGIHGNATCVLNFDGATGYLIGEEHKGLGYMFTFMNIARIGTAIQGLASAELSFQGALEYARERQAMRSLSGPKNPEGNADPIIVHPDVRRMLMTQKALAEGGRAMIYYAAQQADITTRSEDAEARKEADELLSFLTPIAKAFLTETGIEAANLGMQVYGGHGYISEWGMEQIVRDARIGAIYEGTTGIQALDLLGRKVLMTQGESLKRFTKKVHLFCKEHGDNKELAEFIEPLAAFNKEWGDLTMKLGSAAMKDREEVGAASYDYLMYSGYGVLAYLWAEMAEVAQRKLQEGTSEEAFYQAKLQTARFYFQRMLPRARAHADAMVSGAGNLMEMQEEHFAF
ncbi:acyl-CoA dehydrogenase [Halovibrio salipaludis]|uniref:3-methylmercaptopropionyl-CoA dehydrogenase n=1 Tax=Halovibrio salipaludis TaxID=2032626 RepID=A0A2A2F299_9GAMM|nr:MULTISPECIES: acyl-CoA dehydrogenase C-terminal domain-containing protein [Gammaproteobacteria]KAA8979743.1 acyl-CoA dehydrogenase [Halospina sp. K52047b]PAU78745.1 acyl-CoA dehydrogenase [Halovibrio salipaludis]